MVEARQFPPILQQLKVVRLCDCAMVKRWLGMVVRYGGWGWWLGMFDRCA